MGSCRLAWPRLAHQRKREQTTGEREGLTEWNASETQRETKRHGQGGGGRKKRVETKERWEKCLQRAHHTQINRLVCSVTPRPQQTPTGKVWLPRHPWRCLFGCVWGGPWAAGDWRRNQHGSQLRLSRYSPGTRVFSVFVEAQVVCVWIPMSLGKGRVKRHRASASPLRAWLSCTYRREVCCPERAKWDCHDTSQGCQ